MDESAFPLIDNFLKGVATDKGWDDPSVERLRSAGEETLSSLSQLDNQYSTGGSGGGGPTKLVVSAYPQGKAAIELEFVTVLDDENLEDRLAYRDNETEIWDEREISFCLLRHYTSKVHHQKYHGMDVVVAKVERL